MADESNDIPATGRPLAVGATLNGSLDHYADTDWFRMELLAGVEYTLEVDGVFHDPLDGAVIGVNLGGIEQPARWLDPVLEKRSAALQRSFGGSPVTFVSRSQDNQRIVVRVESGSQPPPL